MDYEQLEDFNEALSAAIQSGLDVSCHAVTDMYKETLARAEAAERRAAELEARLAALDDSRYPDYINNGARYEWVGRKGYVLKSMAVSVELDPPAPA